MIKISGWLVANDREGGELACLRCESPVIADGKGLTTRPKETLQGGKNKSGLMVQTASSK
jgi:hypothetical protein